MAKYNNQMTASEAQISYVRDQRHRFVTNLNSSALTITPTPGKKIIIQSWAFKTDGTVSASTTLTFASTGVDSIVYKNPSGQVVVQGFPWFVGDFDVAVTVTLAGLGGVPTYADLAVGFLEIG